MKTTEQFQVPETKAMQIETTGGTHYCTFTRLGRCDFVRRNENMLSIGQSTVLSKIVVVFCPGTYIEIERFKN